MGDKSIHLSASLGIGRKPKDGKDGTSVTILSNKVYYQVSDSPTVIPQDWKDSITDVKQTDAKPYLWTKTVVVYSDTTKTETYSVSYKGKDGTNGTSFTPKGMADGFFNNMSSVPSYESGMDYDVYVVNVDDRSNPTSELPPYVCRYEYESLVVEHAEFGDGYNVNGHLYVANSNEWVDFGEIQGAKGDPGEKGDDGKDAINIVFSPAELVFDADENGNLKQAEKSADIKVFRGNKQLTYLTDWDFPNVGGKQPGDNCNATFMVEENSSLLKPIVKIYDISSTKIEDTKPQAFVPASSGGINVPIKVNDVTYNAYLSFAVNVNTFAHTLIQDNKKYISKYTEVSNKYTEVSKELDNKANQSDMRKVESTIAQMPNQIKLEVYSKTSGRRNMLVNSAFRNQDSVFIHSLARIEKNTGVDGVNCIHSSDKYSGDGDGNYIGAFWDSTQKNGVVTNIPIVKGKKYVISCWIRSDNKDLPFVIECFFMNSINQQNRGEDAVRKEYHVDNVNEWKRIDFIVDTTDTSSYASQVTPYLAVNIWSNNKNVPQVTGANGESEYPTCHAYICKPMMEEGDTYGGWTLSEEDYDYVGGNLLDNTRSLEKSGNLEEEGSDIINEGYEYAYAVAHSNNTTTNHINMLQWNVASCINDGQDYMFSFLAKGTGVVTAHLWKDGTPSFFIEGSNGKHNDVSNDGFMEFDLTNEWRRYWVHYRMKVSTGHPLPEKLLIRCKSGNDIYICQPKLEVGATMTEFTERKTDLVDKASLKKAGIEITTNQVKLYGDKVQVLTRKDESSEYVEAGMFVNGKLNANLIDADAIEVKHLWAKSEDGTTKVGYFGNTENMAACKVDDNTYAPLFIGANNAKNAPFHVTQEGAIYALMGRIGKFSLTDDGIFEYNDGYNTTHKPMRLSENLIYFTHSTDHTTNDRMIWMGNTIHSAPTYGISNLISDIWIDDRESRPTDSKVCLLLHAEGGTSEQSNLRGEPSGNFAICASKGMYAGLRPVTRKVSKSITLSEMDCFVIVTKGITLTLPSNPQRGQYYKFIQAGDNFTIKSSINNLFWKGADGKTSFTSGAYNQTTELIYDGSNWNVNWFREASV
jgi:hypothetical protein